jgi:hypothetical protein
MKTVSHEPLVYLTKRGKYVGLTFDNIRTPWNLSREGQAVVRAILSEAARQTFALGRRKAVYFSAGETCSGIWSVHQSLEHQVRLDVVAVLRNTAFQIPIRHTAGTPEKTTSIS